MEKLVCVEDFEEAALKILGREAKEFYKGGADDEITLHENKTAFKRWILRPRMLRDVSLRTLTTTVLGKPVNFPVGVSPTAYQKLAHPDGEIASARAAAAMGTIFILSTVSTTSLEEVAAATPNSRRWFQLYVYEDRNTSIDLIRRAEANGYEALVVTVDAQLLGKRRSNLRDQFYLPRHLKLANFENKCNQDKSSAEDGTPGSKFPAYGVSYNSLTWKDIKWIKSFTRLPIILKGILTAEDAELAVQHGASAVFVSNHGGRQLDTVLPTIDALPEIVKQVNGRCEVYMDGGVRTGSDAFKALALGAKMVFLGRAVLWGLACGGESGAKKILEIIKGELDLTLALSGVANIGDIQANYLCRHLKSSL